MTAPVTLISAAPKPPWGEGQVLGGRYQLRSPLGAGGMGQVWRAEHVALGTALAVKLLDLTTHRDADAGRSRFLQEARAAARLQSPHVVQILDHGVEEGFAYIAMELLEGESLAERLARQRTLAPEELLKVVRQVALAIEKAHAMGILHRDLKPANIFFARVEGREVVKVLDFGIAKALGPDESELALTQTGVIMGTPTYMSPEQVLGKPLDGRSDLWQLGVLTFECACGELPFQGATLGQLFMNICSSKLPTPSSMGPMPAGFDAWFARATQRDSAARFGSAAELADALEQALTGPPIGFASTGSTPTSRALAAGSRCSLWVAAALGVAVMMASILLVSSRSPGGEAGSTAASSAPGAVGVDRVDRVDRVDHVDRVALPPPAPSAASAPSASTAPAPLQRPWAPPKSKQGTPSRLKRVDKELAL